MTSPPKSVTRPRKVARLMFSLRNLTEPSPMSPLTSPTWNEKGSSLGPAWLPMVSYGALGQILPSFVGVYLLLGWPEMPMALPGSAHR